MLSVPSPPSLSPPVSPSRSFIPLAVPPLPRQDLSPDQRRRVTAALREAAPVREERFVDEIERELRRDLANLTFLA